MPNDPGEPTPAPAPQAESAPPPDQLPGLSPSPDHRDMYLLVIAVLIGLVLSPWIMGRLLSPSAYDRWYFGGGDALDRYESYLLTHEKERKAKHDELVRRLIETGATEDAVTEEQDFFAAESLKNRKKFVEPLNEEREAHERWYRGLMLSLVAAAVVLMFLEPLFDATPPWAPLRRRLVTARYFLLATWLAFALAKPHMVSGLSWVFLAALVAVAILAAVLPKLLTARDEAAVP